MKLLEFRFLRGPNRYGTLPCCLAVIDLGDLAGVLPESVPGLRERLHELAPRALLTPADSPAHLLAQVMLALQCLAGCHAGFSKVRQDAAQPHLYRVACGYQREAVAEMALRQALVLVHALLRGQPLELASRIKSLRALAMRCAMDSGLRAVAAAAMRRRIPLLRLSEDADIYQLGWGCRQQRLQGAISGAAIVDAMFEPGSDGRIPVIAVAGTNGKTTTTRIIAHALRLAGLNTGVTSTEGVDIAGQRVAAGDCTGYWSARIVLGAPQVEAAVLETARGGLLKRGLGFDRCDVAVMLNVSADHLGLDGVHSVTELAAVKAVVVKSATRAVVLNAEDPHCVAMAHGLRRGVEVLYFSLDAENPVLLRHLAGGGRAVYLEDRQLVLAGHERHQPLLESSRMPVTLDGHARHNIANGLAAAAALVGAGHTPELVVAALSTFVSDAAGNPLRGNLFQVGEVRIIVDYAHNAAACASLATMARSMSSGKLVAVMTVPGDRRDGDLHDIGRVCGAGFDELVVYEADPRGRGRGETAELILAGARTAGGAAGWMRSEPDVRTALGMALARCRAGDTLVFTCGSSLDDLIAVVRELDPASAQRIAQTRV